MLYYPFAAVRQPTGEVTLSPVIDPDGDEQNKLQYTYWRDGVFFVGFLNDYPDESTQGVSLAELEESLIEIYEIRQEEKEHLNKIRKTGEVRISKGEIFHGKTIKIVWN